MKIGIIGYPAVGKKTVFQLLTEQKLTPGPLQEPQTFILEVPDQRFEYLREVYQPKKHSLANLETWIYPDLEDLSGKRRGTWALAAKNDLLVPVLDVFNKTGKEGIPSLVEEMIAAYEMQFIMSDLMIVDDRLERIEKNLARGRKEELPEFEILTECRQILGEEKPLKTLQFSDDKESQIRNFQFLSLKPALYFVNLPESVLGKKDIVSGLASLETDRNSALICGSAQIESEIMDMEPDEAQMFREEYGLKDDTRQTFLKKCLELLGLITFYTVVSNDLRAWLVPEGTDALVAAGTIHSDMARGFIRAEVLSYADLQSCGSPQEAKKAGKYALKGKDYIVQDGDILAIRFKV